MVQRLARSFTSEKLLKKGRVELNKFILEGEVDHSPFLILFQSFFGEGVIFSRDDFSLEGGVTLPQKKFKTFPGPDD